MKGRTLFFPVILFLLTLFLGFKPASGCELKDIRVSSGPGHAQCAIVTSGKVDFDEHDLSDPQRVYVDILGSSLRKGFFLQKRLRPEGIIKAVRVSQFGPRTVRVVFEFKSAPNVSITRPSGKKTSGLVLDFSEGFNGKGSQDVRQSASELAVQISKIRKDALNGQLASQSGPIKEKEKSEISAKKSLPAAVNNSVRAGVSAVKEHQSVEEAEGGQFPFNKWRVVIDPGHGGKDPGTSGNDGHHEKQYTLAIARRLAGILSKDPHYEVFLTRDKDKFITLDNRTLFANRVHADIFVSIHINWSSDSATRGITTYFLNWTNDAEANRVAARENQISLKRQKEARTELGYILASLQLEDKRDGSLRLANYIENSVSSEVHDYHPNEPGLGVKEALFYVLVGDKMPAVLVEASFLSNPEDEQLLQERSYVDEVAKGIAAGIGRYFRSVPVRALRAMAQR